MVIHKLYLCKTPLDVNYKNVFDITFTQNYTGDKKANYNDLLGRYIISKYDKIEITATDRSFKIEDNEALLTVRHYEDYIFDYNYIVCQDFDLRYNFFFIVGYETLNDGVNTKTIQFKLKYDSWHNNIDKMCDTVSPQKIKSSHFKRYELVDDVLNPLMYSQNKLNVITNIEDISLSGLNRIPVFAVYQINSNAAISVSNAVPNPESRFRLTKYFTKDEINLFDENEDYIEPSRWTSGGLTATVGFGVYDSVNYKYTRNLLYVCIGVMDTRTGNFVKAKIKSSFNIYNAEVKVDGDYKDVYVSFKTIPQWNVDNSAVSSIFSSDNASNLSQYLQGVYLTCNSPFKYTLSMPQGSYETIITFEDPLLVLPELNNKMPVIVGDYVSLNFDGADTSRVQVSKTYSNDIDVYNIKTIEFDVNEHNGLRSKMAYKTNFIPYAHNVDDIDTPLYCKPFNYISLNYNNESIALDLLDKHISKFKINMRYESPQFRFYITDENGKRLISPTDLFTDEQPLFSRGTDAYASYMIRNGSQHQTAKAMLDLTSTGGILSDLIGGLANFGSGGNIKDITKGITGAINKGLAYESQKELYSAKENDLRNTPNTWYPSMGECDVRFMDRLRIIKHSIYDDNVDIENIKNYFYMYGYDINVVDYPTVNKRAWFDFCQTDECNLASSPINNICRRELENAFDSGITKWHIVVDGPYVENISKINCIKDKSLNNVEIEFITDTDYINWLNS